MTKKAFKYNYPSLRTRERLELVLLKNMHRQLPHLRELIDRVNGRNFYEDHMYRFYYGSCEVFGTQEDTIQIVAALTAISPEGQPLCDRFRKIVRVGTRRKFQRGDNNHWLERTGPIMQALHHARYFLEMAVKYGEQLKEPTQMLPSGWAALLVLYGIR
jgi:hypothetical protein